MRRWMTIAIAAAVPGAAHAGAAAEEIDAGGAPATRLAPGSYWVSDRLARIWDPSAHWQIRADVAATRAYSDAGDATGGDLYLGTLAAVYSVDDHWSLRLSAGGSPEITTRAIMPVSAQGLFPGAEAAEAQLRAVASSCAFGTGVDYDSAADGLHAPSASLSATMTYYNARQQITSVAGPGGATLDAAALQMLCQRGSCDRDVSEARSQQVQLIQFALGASVTDTIDGDTDLSLDAAYYLYSEDPLQSGLFALATVTRSTRGSASGAPLLRDSVAPSVAHRWGNVSANASLSYASYADRGFDLGGSLSVQYKLALAGSHRLKLSVKLAAGSHVDATYDLARSFSGGLGAQYSW